MIEFLLLIRRMTAKELLTEQARIQRLPPASPRDYNIENLIVDMLLDNEINERIWQNYHCNRMQTVL